MHRTPALFEKFALRMTGHAQPAQVPRAVNVAFLKRGRGHAQKVRQVQNVLFGEINEPLLLATVRTSRLALEAHMMCDFYQVYSDNGRHTRTRAGLRHALSACRAEARLSHRIARCPDLPDHFVRLRKFRSR